jgi:hypothetical protein
VYSQANPNAVARRLNARPRKTLDYEMAADDSSKLLHTPVESAVVCCRSTPGEVETAYADSMRHASGQKDGRPLELDCGQFFAPKISEG